MEAGAPAKAPPFVEMYVAGWSLRDRPASSFSFAGVTDVVLFSVLPNADGSLDAATNGLTDERITAVTRRARAEKARVLVAVGGEKTAARFAKATGIASSLAAFVKTHGLDGVVLDIEPLAGIPHETLGKIARDVKAAIDPKVVTIAVAPDEAEIARLGSIAPDLERVTMMSYLGEPSPAREESLVVALEAVGFERRAIGLGIGPQTLIEARENRRARAREGKAGGIALWGIMDAGGLRP